MDTNPKFVEWTAQAVKRRLIEAADTLSICPRAMGPKAFGNTMPEPLRRQIDSYSSNRPRYRRQPSADAIDRMETCWSWINALESDLDRRLLYRWARAKSGRGQPLISVARDAGICQRTLRRKINHISSLVADSLNTSHISRKNCSAEDGRDIETAASKPPGTRTKRLHWRAPGARPEIDGSLPSSRTLP